MISAEIQAMTYLVMVLKAEAPYDTGRLSQMGIRYDASDNHIIIGHDSDRTYADYAIYTEEPWSKGTNPNEGWIERAIEKALPQMKQIYEGISDEDFNQLMDEQQLRYVEKFRTKRPKGDGLH